MIKESERVRPDSTGLTLNEAADLLGVHYMTAYRYVRTGRLPAAKVGGGWLIDSRDLESFRNPPTERSGGARVDWSRRLGDRLIAGDEAGSWSVIESSMAAGLDPSAVHLEVLAPALAEIGAAWSRGEVTIAEEHRATAVSNRLIGRLGPRFHRPGRTKGTIVLGAVTGDQHALPIAIASDLLRGEGFSVTDLGANSPTESFLDSAQFADRLIAVGISSTSGGTDAQVIATATAVREMIGCPVVIGGSGIGDEVRAIFGPSVTTSSKDMIEKFNHLADSRSDRNSSNQ